MDPPAAGGRLLAGRYQLGAVLGRGGMAEVFDGFDTRLARPVAIKLLRPEIAADPAMRARFEREARAAARLSHPNVVGVYDSGEDGAVAFMVMERLPGPSLAELIASGPLDQERVVAISLDVLAALDAAHAIGLIHRDIKPGNILLDSDGRAKVSDFGIAKSVEVGAVDDTTRPDLTQVGQVIGTPAYLAPERLAGQPATTQSDLYALGVVMYEALTGAKPALAAPVDVRRVRPDVAPGLAAVVRRALSVSPGDRYGNARDMLADLQAADLQAADLQGEPRPPARPRSSPGPWSPSPRRWCRAPAPTTRRSATSSLRPRAARTGWS